MIMAGAENNHNKHELREYQLELLELAIEKNIIVCLGTGTGKTFISIKLIENLARQHDIMRPFSEGAKRTFFLVNSVPLVFQQAEAIERHTSLKVKGFCGEMGVDFWSKDDWMKHFNENHVLVMTHQIYLDLLQHARIKLSRANLLVFDECHHANKNHPFKKIMDRFIDFPNEDHPRILGLTASVVGKKVTPSAIPSEVKKLESTMRCECKTSSDPNVVEKYGAKPLEVFKIYSSSQLDEVAVYLEGEFNSVLCNLTKFLSDVKIGKQNGGAEEVLLKEVMVAKSAIRECQAALDEIGIWAAYEVSKMLVDDLEKRRKKVAASLSLFADQSSLFLEVTLSDLRRVGWIYNEFKLANQCGDDDLQAFLKPKVKKLLELFRNSEGNSKVCAIVFVERRYAACVISKLINQLAMSDQELKHLASDFVTGHGADLKGTISETEMKFMEQKQKLEDFRNGTFNVLVGTSVVEEGVDVPKCNLVVMFDFPKTNRAYVQSRGRGRAKEARYVLLVDRDEYQDKKHEQEIYLAVDDYLTQLCQRDRSLPTDEEANDAVNVDLLEPYFTKRNAKVDMGSSIGLLHRYCSKLPCDRFTHLKPKFVTHDVGEQFQVDLQLPRNSAITEPIMGEPMPSKKEAKMAVALEACKRLHKMGALNDNLLPVDNSSESEQEDEDETDGSKLPKTGTKKRQRYHAIKVAAQLEGELQSGYDEEYYVYAVKMKVVGEFEGKKAKTKKKLWDRKQQLFGFVTKNRLPKLPKFSLFHQVGRVEITVEHCLTLDGLKPKELSLINWFHRFIFSEELGFPGSLTNTGCRVLLMSFDQLSRQSKSTKRPYSPTEITEINYEGMRKLKRKGCDEKLTSATDLSDAIVVKTYLTDMARYLVAAVDERCTPLSDFPDPSKATTYKDYYKKRHDLDIKDNSQPLLQVVQFNCKKIDCRRSHKTTTSNVSWECLVPELCTLMKCPQSVALRACLLPAVFYRLQSLLGILELRHTISTQAGIGITSSMKSYVLRDLRLNGESHGLPSKRTRFTHLPDAMCCDSNSDQDDDSSEDATGRDPKIMAGLDKYFVPFDSSRSVSLLKLLEALTCASSADEFDLERLEMLGDSFLKMAVTISAYQHKKSKDEGKLTKYRTSQISNKNLFNLAMKKSLPGYIKYTGLSRQTWAPPGYEKRARNGEESKEWCVGADQSSACDDQQIPDKSIADSVEALIGVHFTQCGYMTALKFMDWLGLKVLSEEADGGSAAKSPHYANYPMYTCEIPEDEQRYRDVLEKQTKEMASFEKEIGYVFKNKELLLEAFTHPSYSENTITGSYQRLEFLGDAVLDFLVTLHIYDNCSDKLTPGKLTDLRSALVNNYTFATVAVDNNCNQKLKEYSPVLFTTIGGFVKSLKEYQKECEKKTGNKVSPNPYIIGVADEKNGFQCIEAPKPLGDVFESLAGAIFVDSGWDLRAVWEVCYRMLESHIDTYCANVPVNPLRKVMEFDNGAKFSNAMDTEDGKVSCKLNFTPEKGKEIGETTFTGVGRNKKNAKLSAASRAVERIPR